MDYHPPLPVLLSAVRLLCHAATQNMFLAEQKCRMRGLMLVASIIVNTCHDRQAAFEQCEAN